MSNWSAFDWRIALTEAALEFNDLAAHDIHSPNSAPYADHTGESGKGDGGQGLHGYAGVELLWNRLTMFQAYRLRKFIDDAKAGTGILYMTIDLNDASAPGNQWVDLWGYPHRPPKTADDGDIAARPNWGQQYIDNFVVILNNVTIINNPSIFTVY